MSKEPVRTLVIGDIHGKLSLLNQLLEEIAYTAGTDRLIFIGDLVDRGEDSRGVVQRVMDLQQASPDLVVCLRGNHEAMMIDALSSESEEKSELWYFNGGVETMQSYTNDQGEVDFPQEHFEFLSSRPTWFEDNHAIYVHAGLAEAKGGTFQHPGEDPDSMELLWTRNRRFFSDYKGKPVIFGHTIAGFTFGEPEKVWLRESLIGIDTGAYLTGVLSAIELPSRRVFSVRQPLSEADLAEWAGARRRLFKIP
jgi:serine/threonine protein phosphatase 1